MVTSSRCACLPVKVGDRRADLSLIGLLNVFSNDFPRRRVGEVGRCEVDPS